MLLIGLFPVHDAIILFIVSKSNHGHILPSSGLMLKISLCDFPFLKSLQRVLLPVEGHLVKVIVP